MNGTNFEMKIGKERLAFEKIGCMKIMMSPARKKTETFGGGDQPLCGCCRKTERSSPLHAVCLVVRDSIV